MLYVPLCGHTTFVLSTSVITMTVVDKVTIFCTVVNKTCTSVDTGNKHSTLLCHKEVTLA